MMADLHSHLAPGWGSMVPTETGEAVAAVPSSSAERDTVPNKAKGGQDPT